MLFMLLTIFNRETCLELLVELLDDVVHLLSLGLHLGHDLLEGLRETLDGDAPRGGGGRRTSGGGGGGGAQDGGRGEGDQEDERGGGREHL